MKKLLLKIPLALLSVLALGFIPSAIAAGSTNPSVDIDEGMLNPFQELIATNSGMERIQNRIIHEWSISKRATKHPPVTGWVGNRRIVTVRSATTDVALAGPVTFNNVFTVKVVVKKDKPKFKETLTAANLSGSTVLVSLAGVSLHESKHQLGGQVRVAVYNPSTGSPGFTATYATSATGFLDVRSSAIVDADGDGTDDLMLRYTNGAFPETILVISLTDGSVLYTYH